MVWWMVEYGKKRIAEVYEARLVLCKAIATRCLMKYGW